MWIFITTLQLQSGWGKTSTYSEVSAEIMKFEILMKPLSYCEDKLDLENLPSESQLCGFLASNVSWKFLDRGSYNKLRTISFSRNAAVRGESWKLGFHNCSKLTFGSSSGSPIQSTLPDASCVFRVAGLASYGSPLCSSKFPLVFTKVFNYLDWIESHVWSQN